MSSNGFSYRDGIAVALDNAKTWAEQIDRDPNLSDEGKAQARAQRVFPAYDDARVMAASWLETTTKRAERARETHLAARRLAAQTGDTQARAYAFERAKTLAETASWEAVSRDMAEAAELGDAARLAAWADLRSLVGTKFDPRSGPASDASTGLRATYHAVDAALASIPPDPLVAEATEQLAEAEAALAACRSDLSRADFRRGVTGEPPLFAEVLAGGARTVTTGGPGPDDGQWVISREGGVGAFG